MYIDLIKKDNDDKRLNRYYIDIIYHIRDELLFILYR